MRTYIQYVNKSIFRRKKDNLLALISITISIALIAIVSIFLDSLRAGTINSVKKNYGEHHIFICNANSNETNSIIKDEYVSNFDEVNVYGKLLNSYINRVYLSEFTNTSKICNFNLVVGRAPLDNEVVISSQMLTNGEDVGDKITLDFIINDVEYTKDFIISGKYSEERYSQCQYALLNKNTLNDINENPNSNLFITLKNHTQVSSYIEKLSTNVSQDTINSAFINESYLSSINGDENLNFLNKVLSMILMCAGAVCIYNIINVLHKRKRKEYGILSALGAKPKQLGIIVLSQSILMLIISIPVGIILAIIPSKLITDIFNTTLDNRIQPIYSISGKTIISIVIMSMITVVIATILPAISSSNTPPLNSINNVIRNVKRHSYNSRNTKYKERHFPVWYPFVIIKRNIKQCILLVLSMSVSLIVFIFFNIYIDYQLKMSTTQNIDFIINDSVSERSGLFTNEYIQKIEDIDGVEFVIPQPSLCSANLKLDETKTADIVKLSSLNIYTNSKLFVIDEYSILEYIDYVVDGNLEDVLNNENFIAILNPTWEKDSKNCYQVGDKITSEITKYIDFSQTSTGLESELTVGAIIKTNIPISDSNPNFNIHIFASTNTCIGLGNENIYSSLDLECDENKLASIKDTLDKYASVDILEIHDIYSEHKEDNKIEKSFKLVILAFSITILSASVLLLIAFYSYYISTRKREFGVLKALGGNNKILSKIILYEAIIYSLLSSILSIGISLIISYKTYKNIAVYPNYFEWEIPYKYLIITVIISFSVNIIVSAFSLRKILKQNTVEAIGGI